MKKIYKLLFIFVIVLFCFSLTSCYKKEKYIFKEGKYEYSGESFEFYNEVIISYISVSFEIVDDSEDNNETSNEDTIYKNIITNRKNNKSYYMDFYIENGDGEGFHSNFIDQEKVGDQVDRYYIELNLSQFLNVDSSIIKMILELHNSNYKSDKSNEANEIYLEVDYFKINEDYISDDEYTFQYDLPLVYVEEK